MGIKSKMIGQTEIKTGGDVFHDIFKQKPHHVSTMAPDHIQGFNLLEGELGTVGSVVSWNYFHDDKPRFAKQKIVEVNEEKKSTVFKMIEGDLMELYKNMTITYHVDTIPSGSLVTMTLDYEKIDVDTPHPGTLLNFLLYIAENIDDHHQKK